MFALHESSKNDVSRPRGGIRHPAYRSRRLDAVYLNIAGTQQSGCCGVDSIYGHLKILMVNLNADAISSPARGGDGRRTGSHEWVQDGIAGKAEHPYETLRQLDGIGSRMVPCRSARQS